MKSALRVIIADDERPARSFLAAVLREFDDIELAGEAAGGDEAIRMIEREQPDLALLDMLMPEIDGLEVVRRLEPTSMPLIAFVTAYDDHAISAFEISAIDYLLKPVEKRRLRETINRAHDRLEKIEPLGGSMRSRIDKVTIATKQESVSEKWLERIPVRRRDDIVLLPVREIASIVAEGELLRLTTIRNHSFIINHRLKDLEARLDPDLFIRLNRGTIVNINMLQKVSPLPGGTYIATLGNGQQLCISRQQGRLIRESLLRL